MPGYFGMRLDGNINADIHFENEVFSKYQGKVGEIYRSCADWTSQPTGWFLPNRRVIQVRTREVGIWYILFN